MPITDTSHEFRDITNHLNKDCLYNNLVWQRKQSSRAALLAVCEGNLGGGGGGGGGGRLIPPNEYSNADIVYIYWRHQLNFGKINRNANDYSPPQNWRSRL